MASAIKSNLQLSSYELLGNLMIVYGVIGIFSTTINFIGRWIFYSNIYGEGNNPFGDLVLYSAMSLISFALIVIAEFVVILVFTKVANRTCIVEIKKLAIMHGAYILYLIGYNFLLPLLLNRFLPFPNDMIHTYFLVYLFAGLGTLFILLVNDWLLYRLGTNLLQQNQVKAKYIIYLPLILMVVRVINFLIGCLATILMPIMLSIGITLIIPIIWIILGKNFKSLDSNSENIIGYVAGEPHLESTTFQATRDQITLNTQDTISMPNISGICSHCGKPLLSQADIFCANCGNRL